MSADSPLEVRGLPGGRGDIAEMMIGVLIDAPVSSPHWKYPHYVAAELNWGRPPQWSTTSNTITPREGKRFMGPAVILTAGSAGNPIRRPHPGGDHFSMATLRAYLPDGGECVGIGQRPTIQQSRAWAEPEGAATLRHRSTPARSHALTRANTAAASASTSSQP